MRIGQRAQLVPVMFRRLMVARLADFDREQVFRNGAAVHDDIGINRLREMIVGRDDRSLRKPQRSLAEPVVVAVDVPARELPLPDAPPADASGPARRDPSRANRFRAHRIRRARGPPCRARPVSRPASRLPRGAVMADLCVGSMTLYICTSISRGPCSATASASALLKSSAVVDRAAGNAHALGERDEVDGRAVDLQHVHARACPGSPAPTPSNSPRRI